MDQSSELCVGPRSSDTCSGPERVLLFNLIWNHSEMFALPAGSLISCSACSRPRYALEQLDPRLLRVPNGFGVDLTIVGQLRRS